METKFNFNSQVCTSKVQSERLLALGLKKETADMYWVNHLDLWMPVMLLYEDKPLDNNDIPAWSLHRLIEMIDDEFVIHLNNFTISGHVFRVYNDLYDNIIECITYLINAGHFNKEYLEE